MFSDVNPTRNAHMRHVNVLVLVNWSHRAWERKKLLNHLLWIASHGTVSKERETCRCTTDLLSMIHFLWKIIIKHHQCQCPSIGKSKWEQLLKVSWWCLERLGIAGVTNLLCKEKLWSVVQQGHFQGGDHWNTRRKAVGRCYGQIQYVREQWDTYATCCSNCTNHLSCFGSPSENKGPGFNRLLHSPHHGHKGMPSWGTLLPFPLPLSHVLGRVNNM